MPNLSKKYGVYTSKGVKLKNTNKILRPMWAPITERVLDRTVNDFFGRLKLKLYVKGEECWIIRESEKRYLDVAVEWFGPKENKDV